MKHYTTVLALFALILIGCEKESFTDIDGEEPKFFATGMVDGNNFNFKAGEASYFMFPNQDQHPYAEGSMVEGILSPTCPSEYCSESIRLRFFGLPGTNGIVDIPGGEQALLVFDPAVQSEGYVVQFQGIDNNFPQYNYEWMIDDQPYTGRFVQDTFEGLNHLVCITKLEGQTPLAQKCRTIALDHSMTCNVWMEVSQNPSGGNGLALAVPQGEPPFNTYWNQPGAEDFLIFENEGQFFVCVTNVDSVGCVAVTCSQLSYEDNQVTTEEIDFNFEATPIPPASIDFWNQFEIVYTDQSGTTYSTTNYDGGCNCLNVIEVKPVYADAINDDVMQITFNFSGGLATESGEVIIMDNLDGTLAFPANW